MLHPVPQGQILSKKWGWGGGGQQDCKMWPGRVLWESCAQDLSWASLLGKICNFYPVTEQIEPWLLFHNLGSGLHGLDCMFLLLSHFQQLQMFLPLGHQDVTLVYYGGAGFRTGDSWWLVEGRWRILAAPPTLHLGSVEALTHQTGFTRPYFASVSLFMCTPTILQSPKQGTCFSIYDHISWTITILKSKLSQKI